MPARPDSTRFLLTVPVAALAIFNFTWIAYEAAIEYALGPNFSKDKPTVQARNFFRDTSVKFEQDMPAFRETFLVARNICRQIDAISDDIEKIEGMYGLFGASAAAELVRVLRNHIVHGNDSTPLSGGTNSVSHFYSSCRLLLMLIQLLVLHSMKNRGSLIPLSFIYDEKGALPAGFVLQNLHRPEGRWHP